MRPSSIAEVAEAAASEPESLPAAIAEFLDAFYLSDGPERQAAIERPPRILGEGFADAMLGAVGEHLARRWGLGVPGWTRRPAHYALCEPRFVPGEPNLRGILLAESPSAFRSRMIFTVAEPLQRARFPRGEARVGVSLAWPEARAA